MLWSSFFECWNLSQLFHSLSLSRGSLVPLHFLALKWYHVHIRSCWYFSQQSWFQLWVIQSNFHIMCSVYKRAYKISSLISLLNKWSDIYSLGIFLSQLWTSLLFHECMGGILKKLKANFFLIQRLNSIATRPISSIPRYLLERNKNISSH